MARVFGTVLGEALNPLCSLKVKLERESIAGERTHIAETSTDSSGYYSLDHDNKLDARLRLRVSIEGSSSQLQSRIVLSPVADQRLDFVLDAVPRTAPPLLAQIEHKLKNVLGDLELKELDENGIARVAICAGLSPRLAILVTNTEFELGACPTFQCKPAKFTRP